MNQVNAYEVGIYTAPRKDSQLQLCAFHVRIKRIQSVLAVTWHAVDTFHRLLGSSKSHLITALPISPLSPSIDFAARHAKGHLQTVCSESSFETRVDRGGVSDVCSFLPHIDFSEYRSKWKTEIFSVVSVWNCNNDWLIEKVHINDQSRRKMLAH